MSTQNQALEAIEQVRIALRANKGGWVKLAAHCKRVNRKTSINYRWLRAFSDRKDSEPAFSKVVELGRALGLDIRVAVLPGRHFLSRP